ncbi:MAG TPA: hypothetical protein VE623_19860 [Acidimicrobiales bacterium]|jgi:hypothetical protein|nr:hypothetical protein [Acidimicrobiales bacterium]
MRSRVSIPLILVIWVVIGVIVAANKNYAENLENGSQIATFILAVVLWPIPALDGAVAVRL